jgi:GC-rich sequence DNA-binding factor
MQGAEPPPVDEDSGGLASEDQIAEAKAARERTRKIAAGQYVPDAKASEDYIPLSRQDKHSGAQAGALRKAGSREGTHLKKLAAEGEQEDELRQWEDEQIRRGGRGTAATDPGAASELAKKRGATGPLWPAGAGGGGAGGASDYRSVKPKTLEEIQLQLHEAHRKLDDELDVLQRRQSRAEADIENAEASLGKLNAELASSSSQYEYFQAVRDRVTDLCFCLREKAPMLEQLHSTVATVRAHRTLSRRQRRAQDLEDELDELSEAGALVERGESSNSAVANDDANGGGGGGDGSNVDEGDQMGRDREWYKQQQRQKRRQKRLERQ